MFLIALSSIALAVLLALGPLFIALLFFDATRRFFTAWIAQLANYALITVLTVMVAALLLRIVQSYAAQTAARGTRHSHRRRAEHDVDRAAGVSGPAPGHAHRLRLGRRRLAQFVRPGANQAPRAGGFLGREKVGANCAKAIPFAARVGRRRHRDRGTGGAAVAAPNRHRRPSACAQLA